MARNIYHPRTRKRFLDWIGGKGGVSHDLCQWEVARFSTCEGMLIIWETAAKTFTLNPVAQKAWDAFSTGAHLDLRLKGDAVDRAFTLDDTDRLLAFVHQRQRVTVADVCGQVRVDCRKVTRRLCDLTKEGRLTTSGGGPGDALWFGCA